MNEQMKEFFYFLNNFGVSYRLCVEREDEKEDPWFLTMTLDLGLTQIKLMIEQLKHADGGDTFNLYMDNGSPLLVTRCISFGDDREPGKYRFQDCMANLIKEAAASLTSTMKLIVKDTRRRGDDYSIVYQNRLLTYMSAYGLISTDYVEFMLFDNEHTIVFVSLEK